MEESIKQEIKELIKTLNLNCSISEFKDKVHWEDISWNQTFSEKFIREFKDLVHWYSISYYQKLSESFIREFKDLVAWDFISLHQELSEPFIYEFKNKLNIKKLIERKLITQEKLDYLEFKEKEKEFNNRTKVSRFQIMDI